MGRTKTICICGGGSLGHAIAASISNAGHSVNMLTGHPERWSETVYAYDCHNKIIEGTINCISADANDVIPLSDIILLCLPGYLIEVVLTKIAPFIRPGQQIGSVVCSNGFFWMARSILGKERSLFGFQRVPFICRVKEYGKRVDIKGYKSSLKLAGINNSEIKELACFFSEVFHTPTIVLSHFLEATLTNSNPILHPARIYAMLASETSDLFEKEFLFYEEWDDKSSEILIACDNEFQKVISKLPIEKKEIPPLLTYYESRDATSLTKKIRSIEAFKGIKMNMTYHEHGFRVDYTNRYFTEDIPYGLLIIKSFAILTGTATPTIDKIIVWMQDKIGKKYLAGNKLEGKDLYKSGIIQNFGIKTIKELAEIS